MIPLIRSFLPFFVLVFLAACNAKTDQVVYTDQIKISTTYPEGTPYFEPEPEEIVEEPEELIEEVEEEPNESIPNNTLTDCPDLVIKKVDIKKRRNKFAIVTLYIKNEGDKTAKIIGDSKEEEDNVEILAYVSGTTKFSRGDLKVGRYILGQEDGIFNLEPGETQAVSLKVPTIRISRFTKVLIFQIDSYNAMKECDNSNNYESFIY